MGIYALNGLFNVIAYALQSHCVPQLPSQSVPPWLSSRRPVDSATVAPSSSLSFALDRLFHVHFNYSDNEIYIISGDTLASNELAYSSSLALQRARGPSEIDEDNAGWAARVLWTDQSLDNIRTASSASAGTR